MTFCTSTGVGTCTNRSTFEPDPDHSPDAGTGLLSPICSPISYALQCGIFLRLENPTYRYWAWILGARHSSDVWFWGVETPLLEVNALYRVPSSTVTFIDTYLLRAHGGKGTARCRERWKGGEWQGRVKGKQGELKEMEQREEEETHERRVGLCPLQKSCSHLWSSSVYKCAYLTLCLPCAALSWDQLTWQGRGFSGLVCGETHFGGSNVIQSIFETVRAGCINSILVQSVPSVYDLIWEFVSHWPTSPLYVFKWQDSIQCHLQLVIDTDTDTDIYFWQRRR